MSQDFPQKEILVRLMDKVEDIGKNQNEHISYARTKLESIETQAKDTVTRVNSLEQRTRKTENRLENLTVKIATVVTAITMAVSLFLNKIL